jgi:ribonuclease HI
VLLEIYADGSSRGNPGRGAWAFIVENRDVRQCGTVHGKITCNEAEYLAVIRALEYAKCEGADEVRILSDSQLIVNQTLGEYAVKDYKLIKLHSKVTELLCNFKQAYFKWAPRTNQTLLKADKLCNMILDVDL